MELPTFHHSKSAFQRLITEKHSIITSKYFSIKPKDESLPVISSGMTKKMELR